MADVTYDIVEHNGGWAYKVGDVFSETFATRADAADAAQRAAEGHMRAGSNETIEFEDEDGIWHEEAVSGLDRPDAEVNDNDNPEGTA